MDDIIEFYNQNTRLFHTNNRPSRYQAETIFEMARRVDPNGGHKQSNCGRCYRNALNAIVKWVRKTTK